MASQWSYVAVQEGSLLESAALLTLKCSAGFKGWFDVDDAVGPYGRLLFE